MEADFQREYQIDLAEAMWGSNPITLRRFWNLVLGLPLDGALARSYDPKRLGRGWTVQTELLAIIAELIDTNNRLFLSANSKKGAKIPTPIFIRRPDDNERKKTPPPPGSTRKWMAARGIPVVTATKKKV